MKDNAPAAAREAMRQAIAISSSFYSIFGRELRFIGSLCSQLRGVEVQPRDLDPFVSCISEAIIFEDRVLQEFNYERASGTVWQNKGFDAHVPISATVSKETPHKIIGSPGASWSWDFPDTYWDRLQISDGVFVEVPCPTLYCLLKLKSISDKIWLVQNLNLEAKARGEWMTLLIRDIKLAKLEIIGAQNYDLIVDDAIYLMGLADDPLALAKQMLKSVTYISETLDLSYSEQRRLHLIESFLSIYARNSNTFSGDAQTEAIPRKAIVTQTDKQGVYFDRTTGLVMQELESSSASPLLPSAPYFASVQLNAVCNLRCAHCFFEMKGAELPYSLLKSKIDEMQEAGVLQISFGEAGEALLYEHLSDAIRYASTAGLVVNLSTNLSIEPSSRLWETMEQYCSNIAISVDEFHFHNIRSAGIPRVVKERISRISASRATVTLSTVYEAGRISEFKSCIDQIIELMPDQICVIRRIESAREGAYKKLSFKDMVLMDDVIRNIAEKGCGLLFHSTDPITLIYPSHSRPSAAMTTAGWETIFLNVEGLYKPAVLADKRFEFDGTIGEAWKSDAFADFRRGRQVAA